jgi:hypothetical protein
MNRLETGWTEPPVWELRRNQIGPKHHLAKARVAGFESVLRLREVPARRHYLKHKPNWDPSRFCSAVLYGARKWKR